MAALNDLSSPTPAPTATVEDYLKCIIQEGQLDPAQPVSTGRIAARLGLSPGSVTAMIKSLARKGLVDHRPYGGVRLSEEGRRLALDVLRRHRLLELFLVEILGFGWSEVHAEAERLEHAVSDRVMARIDEMLGRPRIDPHGDPIPTQQGGIDRQQLATLLDCPVGRRVRIVRIRDQREEFLRWLEERALVPGRTVVVEARDPMAGALTLGLGDDRTEGLGLRAASNIQVRLAGDDDPSPD